MGNGFASSLPETGSNQKDSLFLFWNIGLLIFTADFAFLPNAKAQRRRGSDSAEGNDALPGVLCSAWFGAGFSITFERTAGVGQGRDVL